MTFATLIAVLGLAVPPDADCGYLAPTKDAAGTPYRPRAGDLVFFDDHHLFWSMVFRYAGSGPPLHVGIIVKKGDGSLAVLEAGPDDSLSVRLQDVGPRLEQFAKDYKGTITIRRCRSELTPQRSEALTRFALAQEGKPYALARLLLQATPFRIRGPFLERFLARTDLEQPTWICSELTVAAGTVAGLFPPAVKANVTYPRDIVDNRRHDLSASWHDLEAWRSRK